MNEPTNTYAELANIRPPMGKDGPASIKLTVDQLACAMYEGTRHVQNLAEVLARAHGQAGALTFYDMMGDDVRNFWRSIAAQLIEHARHWQENVGSACSLDDAESARLAAAPRINADGSAEIDERAMHVAARVWQDQDMTDIEMDSVAAQRIAAVIHELIS